LGHSLGGYVTLAFAEAYPQRLRGFGLIHSTALPDGEDARANRDKAVQTIAEQGIIPFVDGLVPKLFAEANAERLREKVQRAIAIGYGTSPQGAAATALGMKARPDRTRIVHDSALPVLLLAGAGDRVIPVERTLTPAGRGARQVLLE